MSADEKIVSNDALSENEQENPDLNNRERALKQGIYERTDYIIEKYILENRAKKAIAEHIAKTYVKDYYAVLLDAGSTAEIIAEQLFIQRKYLSVMTNNLGAYAAYTRAVAKHGRNYDEHNVTPGIGLLNKNELLLSGGRYDATYEALFGDRTIEAIRTFTPNVTIIAVSGLRFTEGVFCHGSEEVGVKQLLWTKKTDIRLIAADWTKIGKRDAHAFGVSVDQLSNEASKAVVVTTQPGEEATSEEIRNFDEQVRIMRSVKIDVDVLSVS